MRRIFGFLILLIFPLAACNLDVGSDPSLLREVSMLEFKFNSTSSQVDILNLSRKSDFFYKHPLYYFSYVSSAFMSGNARFIDHYEALQGALRINDYDQFEVVLVEAKREVQAYVDLLKAIDSYQKDSFLIDRYLNVMEINLGLLEGQTILKGFSEQFGGWEELPPEVVASIHDYEDSTYLVLRGALNDLIYTQELFLSKYAEEIRPLIDDLADLKRLEFVVRNVDLVDLLDLEVDDLEFKSAPSSSLDVTENLSFVFDEGVGVIQIKNPPEDVDYFYDNPLDYYYYLDHFFLAFLEVWDVDFESIIRSVEAGELEFAWSQAELLLDKTRAYHDAFANIEGYESDLDLRDVYVASLNDYAFAYEEYFMKYFEMLFEAQQDESQMATSATANTLFKTYISDAFSDVTVANWDFREKYAEEIDPLFLEY